jgi:hypothetical protein
MNGYYLVLGQQMRFLWWEQPAAVYSVAIMEDVNTGKRYRVTEQVLRDAPRIEPLRTQHGVVSAAATQLAKEGAK